MESIELFFSQYKIPLTVLHVLSVVLGMGAALMSDFLFNFYTKDKALSKTEISTLHILSKVVRYALPIIILTGVGIFLSNIDKYLHSTKFLVKMTLMGILLVNGFILDKYIWSHLLKKQFFTSDKEKNVRRLSFICGATSVITWLFICILGVLDSVPLSYWQLFGIYSVLLFGSFPIAIAVEFKEFEK
jgi:hypothetical protein